MAGGEDGGDAAVGGRADDAVAARRVNGEARAEGVRGKGGVGDVAGGENAALQRHLPFGGDGVGIAGGRGLGGRGGVFNRGGGGREAFRVVAAAREDEGQAEGNGKGDHHPDDVRRQVLRADGDDARDTGGAEGDGFGFVEGDVGAGAGGADEGGVEGVAQTQIDAEHRRFGDAEHGGDAGGGGDAFQFGVFGAEKRAEGGRALRDVVHRGDGEDEGAAGVGDVGDELGFDRNKAVVHAGDDDRRVEAAEDGAAQDAGGVVQPLDGIGEGDTGVARRRPDDGKGEQRGDEDGQERRQQQIDACRDDAAQAAFQFGEYPAADEDGQHRAL